jgi:hypothetical protein
MRCVGKGGGCSWLCALLQSGGFDLTRLLASIVMLRASVNIGQKRDFA